MYSITFEVPPKNEHFTSFHKDTHDVSPQPRMPDQTQLPGQPGFGIQGSYPATYESLQHVAELSHAHGCPSASTTMGSSTITHTRWTGWLCTGTLPQGVRIFRWSPPIPRCRRPGHWRAQGHLLFTKCIQVWWLGWITSHEICDTFNLIWGDGNFIYKIICHFEIARKVRVQRGDELTWNFLACLLFQ